MQKKNIYIIFIIILLIIVLCGLYILLNTKKPNTTQPSVVKQITISKNTILLSTHGSLDIFTDTNGMTLYHSSQDWPRDTKPPYNPYTKCTGTCSVTWPPFYTDNIKISPPLRASDFSVFTRPDGKKQVAYRGWPLYYYSGDIKPGDVNGQGIENTWYAGISPD
jgi:predicted lipoprotein with Yx(FWY)xxD motif